jgi:hypothetical protein
MERRKSKSSAGAGTAVSGRGTGIPIFGQGGHLDPCTRLRKSLTKRCFRRTLLGKGFAPRKGDNYYGHPKTIKRKS